MEYLDTDTIIFWASEDDDSGGDLLKKQKAQWGPVLDFVREKYQITPQISHNFLARPILQPAEREHLEKYLQSMNPWALCAFQNITESLKSFYLSLALSDGFIESEKAVALSLLETSHQEDKWGNVPWYHDVERADLCARVSSALIVFLTSFEQYQVKQVADSAFMRSLSSQ
ncbi:ATP synthase mitochondrial F1 complex assembly factor 2 [Cichlidogyrus casuarinus]|uniref:ATP synthase mitochondrial F1 complex assembly factor 2 n=1 Tax=Cichlidogyrus casuarinus TaxID=1844966 RepID=A0ABD2QM16_9PLAT